MILMKMDKAQIQQLFAQAAEFDPTLKPAKQFLSRLPRKMISPITYDREVLFRNMADGKISVFENFPSPLRTPALRKNNDHAQVVLNGLLKSRLKKKIRAKTGRLKTEKYFSVQELVKKWKSGRGIFNVTDFHFRESKIDQVINPARLSQFNLYPGLNDEIAQQEMMTIVMSTVGGCSDSHSDDSDGSNHCFVGKKLWLAWDTNEGLAAGVEDLERVDVFTACKFDFKSWLSLKSACWFTVENGQTLFMPGHLTHKVITLEPYLGVGSFYLSLPNFLRTLSKWVLHKPNWQVVEATGYADGLYPEVLNKFINKINRLSNASENTQHNWGYDFLGYATQSWTKQYSNSQRKQLLGKQIQPNFSKETFIQFCKRLEIINV